MNPHKVPELPANVLKIRPDVVVEQLPKRSKRPKRVKPGELASLKSVTPCGPDLNSKTRAKKGKKLNSRKPITKTPASTEISVPEPEASSNLTPQQLDAAFRKLVQSLGKMELRRRFRLEAISHLDMMNRRRTHGAVVHPAFHDFRSFLLHVGQRPLPTWTLDRLNPHDPEYAPKKVRWADKRSQANNRRNTILLTVRGETRPLTDWARLTKQDPKTLRRRLKDGWSQEEAVYGRNKVAPEPPVEPVEAEGYVWPGSQQAQASWEEGFRSFVAFSQHQRRLRLHGPDALTRDAFLAWIGGNILDAARFELRERWPSYGDPDWDEPQELQEHLNYRIVGIYRWPVLEARCRALNSPAQGSLLRNTLKHYSRPTAPHRQNWAGIFDG